MNYREKIRRAIACPQFGDDHYGEWGALRLDIRKLIKRLLDELDRTDEYIKFLYQENQSLRTQRDKAIDYITTEQLYTNYQWGKTQYAKILKDLLEILGVTKVVRDKAVVWKEEAIIDEER